VISTEELKGIADELDEDEVDDAEDLVNERDLTLIDWLVISGSEALRELISFREQSVSVDTAIELLNGLAVQYAN